MSSSFVDCERYPAGGRHSAADSEPASALAPSLGIRGESRSLRVLWAHRRGGHGGTVARASGLWDFSAAVADGLALGTTNLPAAQARRQG